MKLIILLSIFALAACEYPAAQPEPPADSYGAPAPNPSQPAEDTPSPSSAPIDLPKSIFSFGGFQGAFPPSTIPPANFLSTYSSQLSLKYPLKAFSYPLKNYGYPSIYSAQGIIPPQFAQIIPPVSQIVPPISQVFPPVFGSSKPTLPINPAIPQVVSPQVLSQTFTKPTTLFSPQIPYLYHNYAFPSFSRYSYFNTPFAFSFFSNSLLSAPTPTPAQKEPEKTQEPLSTSYGPPAPTPAETSAPFEPSGPAESSAPFEPSPVSYSYDPPAPETPEPAPAPYKPAQEYGVPS